MGCFYFGFRYEVFWLPLIAEFPDATVAAPLDIAWVWHVHMLSPLAYERDSNEIVSTLVDHKILVLLGGSFIGRCARNVELSAVTNGMSIPPKA